jgi:hypothetical protein
MQLPQKSFNSRLSLPSSNSWSFHLSPRGWFISLPRKREAGVAAVDSCHAEFEGQGEGRKMLVPPGMLGVMIDRESRFQVRLKRSTWDALG